MSNNQQITKLLITEYGKICFLGGLIRYNNIVTAHHIIKSGPTSKENIALVARLEHDILHILEKLDPRTYTEINDFLIYYKNTSDDLARLQVHRYILNRIYSLGYYPIKGEETIVLRKKSTQLKSATEENRLWLEEYHQNANNPDIKISTEASKIIVPTLLHKARKADYKHF